MSSRLSLITGVALAVITAVLLGIYIARVKSSQTSEPFLRLAPDVTIAQGTTVSEASLATAYLPESAGALVSIAVKDTPENREWLKGRRVARDIAPGSLLLYEYFNDQPADRFAGRVSPGKRAISIEATASSAVSFLIEPGSHVDIVGTLSLEDNGSTPARNAPEARQKFATQTILQNVRVLAVGNLTSRGAYSGAEDSNYSTVTIEVTPEEAEKLVFARANLKDNALNLLLRNPADNAVAELPKRNWAQAQ
jgi:Flp pilus assembly protein CpaB